MAVQTVFKRYELKYLLTLAQKETVLKAMQPYMTLDKYGRTTIRNLYYDTDTYLLIRRSIEKPAYKEKLRLRSYSRVDGDSTAFVELKKKYNRLSINEEFLCPTGRQQHGYQGRCIPRSIHKSPVRSTISSTTTVLCILRSSFPMNGRRTSAMMTAISVLLLMITSFVDSTIYLLNPKCTERPFCRKEKC